MLRVIYAYTTLTLFSAHLFSIVAFFFFFFFFFLNLFIV